MAANRIYTYLGRLLAAWIAVTGLFALEHRGVVKSGGTPIPGVTVTADGISATTASDGTYTISGVPSGTWSVTPSRTERLKPASSAVTR